MPEENPEVRKFMEPYGPDARVLVGQGMEMTLGSLLEAEEKMCPPENSTARLDPKTRIPWLANVLAAGGSLRPEDEHYLKKEN